MSESSPVRLLLPTMLPLLRVLLIAVLRGAYQGEYLPPPVLLPEYDFIIVGGGTAGCVLASRLSEVASWRVLLLEAGGAPPPESLVPGLSRVFYFPSESNWNFRLHPQRYALRSYTNRSSPVPQGRVLGGSSTINGMLYVRGNRRDYDYWASMGLPGWDYQSVLPFFKKAESYRGTLRGDTENYHGREGPLPVTPDPGNHGVTSVFLKAGQHLGFPVIDPSGPEQIGFSRTEYTIKNGERWHTARAYLAPVTNRINLHVVTGATVLKVIMNGEKRAVGVKFLYHGKVKKVSARREVLLSAGALSSPKLLMLSGIGHRLHLQEHGVKVVTDLPGVGQNLQDHMCLYGLSWNLPRLSENNILGAIDPAMLSNYVHHRSGTYATPLGDFAHGWARVHGYEDQNWPDVQLFMISSGLAQEGLLAASALGLDTRPLEACSDTKFGSDAYWRCFVLHMATTFYHFAGTCKMGPDADPFSVLDHNLKVRGVSGLRVVDASVMPVVVSGNPMAAIIMIAEKAAHLLKHEWGATD
nr:glucose dehydrogenase [FAD, quinone]-like [Cherax quadricarinatus]